MGAPSNGAPTRPSLARNCSMMLSLKSAIALLSAHLRIVCSFEASRGEGPAGEQVHGPAGVRARFGGVDEQGLALVSGQQQRLVVHGHGPGDRMLEVLGPGRPLVDAMFFPPGAELGAAPGQVGDEFADRRVA